MKTPDEIKYTLHWCRNSDANNQCLGCPYKKIEDCEYALEADAYAYIQRLEQRIVEVNKTSPRWISVKEREPERLQRALVYSPAGNRIASGVYTECGFITQAVMGEITHWMEIPEPPKEDT